jgi:hypothetical protein
MTITEINIQFAKASFSRYVEKKEINLKGCFIPLKKPRADGYVRFSVTRGSTKNAFGYECGERTFYLHQLAWYASDYQVPLDSNLMQLSHLCLDSRCFNVKHMVLESPKDNNARKNCGQISQCPKCEHMFRACEHTPKCITRPLQLSDAHTDSSQ